MKLSIRNYLIIFGFLIPIFFTSCNQNPIFAAIEEEQKIADATVNSTVTSLVSFNGSLWVTDGYLRQKYGKSGADGNWNNQNLPGSATRCQQIATDGTNLYALFQKGSNWDFDSIKYTTDGNNWIDIDIQGKHANSIFGAGNRIILFTGKSVGNVDAWIINPDYTLAETASAEGLTNVTGMAAIGTTIYFSSLNKIYMLEAGNTVATAITDGPTSNICGIASDDTSLYAVTPGFVFCLNGATWTNFPHDTSSPTSIAVLKQKHLLLIGGNKGYSEVDLSNANKAQTPGKAENSSIGEDDYSQYNTSLASYDINGLFIFEEPAILHNDDNYIIFATVIHASTSRAGLWSYFPGTRSSWNRE